MKRPSHKFISVRGCCALSETSETRVSSSQTQMSRKTERLSNLKVPEKFKISRLKELLL